MPIDIVKKDKKKSVVNLRRRQVLDQENKKSRNQGNKKSLEERMEKRFAHIPDLAYKQKVKIMWSTVIFFSGIIVMFWFYLAGSGALFHTLTNKEKKDDFIKLSELTSGFNKLKNISINELSGKKDVILNLKNKLEIVAAKSEVINNLKDNLQKKVEGEYDSESNKVVCKSGNLIATYPLPNYYIDNPIKILGRGNLLSGEFKIRLEDSNGKILGESNGITEKGQTMSSFAVELSYSDPETKTGILQLYTLSQKDENKDDLISIPVNFIFDLSEWNIYNNEELGFAFKFPKNSAMIISQNGLLLNSDEELMGGKEKITERQFYLDYFSNVKNLQESYTPDLLSVYDNLDLFLRSGNLGENEKPVYVGGLKFNLITDNDVFYRIFEKEAGGIAVLKSDNKESNSLGILDQILATFKFIEPNLENWKEYKDIIGDVSFKYPFRLNKSEELGQFIFRDQDPDGFSFYFFVIEPQIDNLEKWVQESSINLEEKVIKYEDKSFGDVALGVYYEAEARKDDSAKEDGDQNSPRSFGYMFNHYGTTYSLRTNKENFQNTFKNVLNSIKFNSSENKQELSQDSNN